jgi:predicted metal-dependent hydrolase
MTQVQVGGQSVNVTFKAIKNVNLKIAPPDGQVQISAPHGTRLATIEQFVREKQSWIEKHQARLQAQAPTREAQFLDGETYQLWGADYYLRVRPSRNRKCVEISGDEVVLHCRAQATREQRYDLLEAWLRQQLRAEAEPLIAHWAEVMQVKPNGLYVQRMKTRWGSCNIRRATIRLNSDLAHKPVALLEYVVVHELVHLFERYHNARFYRLMDKFLPDWQQKRQSLNYPQQDAVS